MHRQALRDTRQVENLSSWCQGLAAAAAEDNQLFAGSVRQVQRGRCLEAWSIDVLPPLAWMLDLGRSPPTLVCGPDVEVFEDGFFEGCWAGDFTARDFAAALHVFGSGARWSHDRWLVVTPSHTMDAVYLLERRGWRIVSNSLAFLTRWADLELPYDRGLAARMISVRDGTDCYERLLFQGEDWSIRRVCFDNLEVGAGEPCYVAKPACTERFADFADYEEYLRAQLSSVAANGADRRRRFRYEVTSTCSSGYDSSACAALAAALGARRAFTIVDARGGGSDSGRPVLEKLGLEAVELNRAPRPNGQDLSEAEFIASGMGGDEFPFAGFAPNLRRTILLTGLGGERMWGCLGPVSRNAHQNDEPAGGSLAEFRLRCGFVHLPVGWIGFENQPELRSLCNSAAMRPWHTGGNYERPIARRILEERGVPRGMFGVVKRGTSMPFYFAAYWWSKAAITELRELERWHLPGLGERLAYRADGLWRTWLFTAYFAARKAGKLLGLATALDKWRDRLFSDFWKVAYTHPRYMSMAFLWGQSRIRSRYPRACDLEHHLHRGAGMSRDLLQRSAIDE